MVQARRAAAAAAALFLAACKSSSSPPPPPPTFSVSGTIHAVAATAADGDTNDATAPKVPNNTAATAKQLAATVTLGGWAHSSQDPQDWYRATLAAGQVVTLQIADWTDGGPNDLDLCLYILGNLSVPVSCSKGTGPTESVSVAASGTYFIQVIAYTGASRYVLTLAEPPLSLPAANTLRPEAEFVPGEVVVRFKDGAAPAGVGLAARARSVGLEPLGGEERREMRLGLGSGPARARAFAALGVSAPARDAAADPLQAAKDDTIALVKALRRRPDVASADPNYVFHPTLVPNDQFWSLQWDFPLINLPTAWDVTTGTPAKGQVVVAVVDTGVFLAHPDLSPKLVSGYDFISNPSISNDGDGIDPNPDDPGDNANITLASFHGTHVSGTIGAATNDAIGVAGVSWGAKIMPVRVLGIGGGTSFDIIEGIRFAAGLANDSGTFPAQKADVINLSLGCGGCPFSQTEQDTYTAVRGAGVVVVAAAGNDSTSVPSYPAAYAGVLSVSAVGPSKTLAFYSNFGSTIDIAAPGGNSQDTAIIGAPQNEIGSTHVNASSGTRVADYAYLQGTSMATPHVAGVIALMKAVCPTLTPDQVDGFLTSGGMTDDLGAVGRDNSFGWGLVNAQKAVDTALTQCTSPASSVGATPSYLEVAPPSTSATFATAIVGGDTLTGDVTASEDASWLTLTPPAGNGIGTWTATVNRTGLAAGVYSATITLSAPFTSGTTLTHVPVTMQVGGTSGAAGDAGYLHIRLLDGAQNVVKELALGSTAGNYAYSFTGLAAGSYSVVAGTDMNGDGVLCGPGEACGAYPVAGAPAVLDVTGDKAGLDFTVGFDVGLGAAAAPAGKATAR